MNTTILAGASRHVIQFAAGAIGYQAVASGEGLELAVAAVVSLAALGRFVWVQRKAA